MIASFIFMWKFRRIFENSNSLLWLSKSLRCLTIVKFFQSLLCAMFILSFEFVKMRWMKNFCYHSMWSMNCHVMFFVSWTFLLISFLYRRNNNWKSRVDIANLNEIKKASCEINRMRNRRNENFFMILWLTNKIWNWNNKFTNRVFNWLKNRNDKKCNMIFEIAKSQW